MYVCMYVSAYIYIYICVYFSLILKQHNTLTFTMRPWFGNKFLHDSVKMFYRRLNVRSAVGWGMAGAVAKPSAHHWLETVSALVFFPQSVGSNVMLWNAMGVRIWHCYMRSTYGWRGYCANAAGILSFSVSTFIFAAFSLLAIDYHFHWPVRAPSRLI